ncbi:unnamed protein product [Caenorhabditis auriculariae]|uniref:7TM GPCR serpentine receptor class x (Srx) domain-containing protein n=1 Tax=Caenorhabditis auriculariae TaxID=2777116 RepID=A0A8S1H129_9PELO|nr:unnamed protein product [Caenorhabditis auriculariae]
MTGWLEICLQWLIRLFVVALHLLSYSFNGMLVYLIVKKKVVKTWIYVCNMVVAEVLLNLTQHASVEFNWVIADAFKNKLHTSFFVQFTSYVNLIAFEFRYFLTLLMSVNRLLIVLFQGADVIFKESQIILFSLFIWFFLVFMNLSLFLNNCLYFFDWEEFRWIFLCPKPTNPLHYVSYYLYFLPIATFVLNITGVVYVKLKRSDIFILSHMMTGLSRNSENNRRLRENFLVFHAFIISVIMSIDSIYTLLHNQLAAQFRGLSPVVKELLGSSNLYISSLINFLIYFACNSNIRQNVLTIVLRRPRIFPNGRTIVIPNSL